MAWLLLIFLLPAQAFCQETPGSKPVYGFGGVDNYHDSSKILDTDAQDALNVVTADGNIKTRTGNKILLELSTASITFAHEYIDSSGNHVLIVKSSNTLYATNTVGVFVSIGTMAAGTPLNAVNAFGKVYFTNGTDTVMSYSGGTSTAACPSIPKGKFIDYANERLYVGYGSTVSVSAYNSATDWVVPSTDTIISTAPATFVFNPDDSDSVTCAYSSPWGYFFGKRHSAYVVKGIDNDTFYKRIISPVIGCTSDGTMQMFDGALVYLWDDGVYSWTGSGQQEYTSSGNMADSFDQPKLISLDIKNSIKDILATNSFASAWSMTSASDFGDGHYSTSPPVAWKITSSPGEIVTTGESTFDNSLMTYDFTDEGFESAEGTGWTIADYGSYDIGICNIGLGVCPTVLTSVNPAFGAGKLYSYHYNPTFSFDSLQMVNSATDVMIASAAIVYTSTWAAITIPPQTATTTCKMKLIETSSSKFIVSIGTFTADKGANLWVMYHDAVISGLNTRWHLYDRPESTGTNRSSVYNVGTSSPRFSPATVSYSTTNAGDISFTFYFSTDSTNWTSSTTLGPYQPPYYQYYKYAVAYSTVSAARTFNGVTFAIAPTTGAYSSPVKFVGADVSSWGIFNTNYVDSEVNLSTFFVRSNLTSFAWDSSTIAWTVQTPNTIPTITVKPYIQWKIDTNIITATQSVTVQDVTVNSISGTVSPEPTSLYYDHAYYMSVSTSNTAANDTVFVLQKNRKWVMFNGDSYGAMLMYNNKPVAAHGETDGKIWNILQDGVYTDDGKNYPAYWIGKNFAMDYPNQDKVLSKIWLEAIPVSGVIDLNIGYSANRATTYTSTRAYSASSLLMNQWITGIPDGYALGRQFAFKIANYTTFAPYSVNGYTFYYTVKPLVR